MSKRLRSCMAVVMAAFFALAVMVVPKTAWAVENPVQTPYGTIGYTPNSDGFNLTVELYVNDEADPVETISLGKIGDNHIRGSLTFEPAEGFYYHNWGASEYGYEFVSNTSAKWEQSSGTIHFATYEETQKTYPNVLKIHIYTFDQTESAMFNLRTNDQPIILGDENAKDHVIGYTISYTDYDPVTGADRVYSHEVRERQSAGALDFVDQPIPKNTDVGISVICDPGYEASEWMNDSAGQCEITGDEGTEGAAGLKPQGNVATVKVTTGASTPRISLEVHAVREALPPNTDKDAALTAEVTVKCTNDYAGHGSSTVPLEESTYTLGNASGQGQGRTLDATVDSTSYITAFSEGKGDHTLTSTDNVITFVHDGKGWVPAENESPLVFEVTCDVKPSEPSEDLLDEIIGKNILVSCSNAASGHLTGHYSLSEGEYEGVLASGEDGYTYTVTVKADKFVAAYSDATKTSHSPVGANTATVTLVNSGTGWKIQSGTPVEFEVVCTSAPTLDDITAAFDGELVKVKCTNANNEHGYDTKRYGAIGGGVKIGKVANNGTVEITVFPAA